MKSRYFFSLCLAFLLLTPGSLASGQGDAMAILKAAKAAAGGASWDKPTALVGTGTKRSFGLKGSFTSVEVLRSGWFQRTGDYSILRNAEGLDAAGRWRMDNSGGLHPLDSPEAVAVARTDAYLAGRGYFFPEQSSATLRALDPVAENGHTFDLVEATPQSGRSVVLWIDRNDHLVHRAVVQLSTVIETIDYRDYRPVGGLWLPFEIDISNGDQPETGTARILAYSLADERSATKLLTRPEEPHDHVIHAADGRAHAPFTIDRSSNFPIVWASINGGAPLPFILDTGGHDILTPKAARRLGLNVVGSGFSLGAGSGSTPTRFTKVNRLSIGEAEIAATPFTILEIDLGQTATADGKSVEVAGLLGLELFERFTITLAPSQSRLTLEEPNGQDVLQGAQSPIRFTRDVPLIEASLAGHKGLFAFDTGNNAGLIVAPAWASANNIAGAFANGRSESGMSVGGPVSLQQGSGLDLAIGPLQLGPVPALLAGENMGSLSARSEAGNLGLAQLAGFEITIDYARQRLALSRTGH
jgi:hypothetical protein